MTLWRIRATVDDRPGYLSVLTTSLALRSVNILLVQVHATEAGAVDDFIVDAPAGLTKEDLVEAVRRGRGRDPWVAPWDASGLVDEPTRVLSLAARVVADPDSLEQALLALLGADAITWRPDPTGPGVDGTLLRLADPAGGQLLVRRIEPAFTPAEYARAQSLVALAGAGLARARQEPDDTYRDSRGLLTRGRGDRTGRGKGRCER